MQTKEYKLLLLGEKQIGKTCFLRRLNNTYRLNNNYIPTLGVDVTSIDMNKESGKIRLNIWDNAGDIRFRGLKEKYYIGSDLAIIFRNNNNNHLIFENELSNDIKKLYIDNYNIDHPEYSINEYKHIIYNIIINN